MRKTGPFLVSMLLAAIIVFSIGRSIDSRLVNNQTPGATETPAVLSEVETPAGNTRPAPRSESVSSEKETLSTESSGTFSGNTLALESEPDAKTNRRIQQYVNTLAAQGFSEASQGIWMQSDGVLLANYQGTLPLPAASLTKAATTLASLDILGANYQFSTLVGTNGALKNGLLEGDLIVQGSADPFFIWEEAITIGNLLNQIGIRQVSGDLVIVDSFYMNYQQSNLASGELLKESLNADLWTADARAQYQEMPSGTAKPRVLVRGQVRAGKEANDFQLLLNHKSLPLVEILKKMNQYSNNVMADILAMKVGGADVVANTAAKMAGVPTAEIRLINGSGLGVENQMSPRAVCAVFLAIDNFLQPYDMTVSDVFTVVGEDPGVLTTRPLPTWSVMKSGSLSAASAIAGALPTQKQNIVWFSIINGGNDLVGFRASQETLLNELANEWGPVSQLPAALKVNKTRASKTTENEISQ
ncbi:MAG: D-alanyl-D-alanine carboxypeptidase [Cyanobacteria bacterium J06560_2]